MKFQNWNGEVVIYDFSTIRFVKDVKGVDEKNRVVYVTNCGKTREVDLLNEVEKERFLDAYEDYVQHKNHSSCSNNSLLKKVQTANKKLFEETEMLRKQIQNLSEDRERVCLELQEMCETKERILQDFASLAFDYEELKNKYNSLVDEQIEKSLSEEQKDEEKTFIDLENNVVYYEYDDSEVKSGDFVEIRNIPKLNGQIHLVKYTEAWKLCSFLPGTNITQVTHLSEKTYRKIKITKVVRP